MITCSLFTEPLFSLFGATCPRLGAVGLSKKKVKTSVDRLDYLVISAHYMYFKVFRYSFSETIPIFFNRLKSVFSLVRSP